jgi:hypothetical protein
MFNVAPQEAQLEVFGQAEVDELTRLGIFDSGFTA